MITVSDALQLPGTVIIDVRTPAEFMGGNVAGSINIPLDRIPNHLKELGDMKHIVLCCASGGRSRSATALLRKNGIDCLDGGAWTQVNFYVNKNN